MKVTDYPKAYQSAFREACFTLGEVSAGGWLDVGIYTPLVAEPLGVKRIYGNGEMAVNVAPYVRALLSPEPLCGAAGLTKAAGRTAACFISATGCTSATVRLTAGTDDAPSNTILSALPGVSKIRLGERDEISLITGGNSVRPMITFRCGGAEYTDYSFSPLAADGMITFVVDADAIGALFSSMTGADAPEMEGFTVILRVAASPDIYLSRHYEVIQASHTGLRLAWINRYGAVDYFTFPYSQGGQAGGKRECIYASGGYRTIATSSEKSETLMSGQTDAATAEWLSEIFSSPAAWSVSGNVCEKVEVAEGSAEYSPLRPCAVSVTVGPAKKPVSRKF